MRVFEVDLAASECLPRLKAYLNRHFNICLPYLDLIQTFVSHVTALGRCNVLPYLLFKCVCFFPYIRSIIYNSWRQNSEPIGRSLYNWKQVAPYIKCLILWYQQWPFRNFLIYSNMHCRLTRFAKRCQLPNINSKSYRKRSWEW